MPLLFHFSCLSCSPRPKEPVHCICSRILFFLLLLARDKTPSVTFSSVSPSLYEYLSFVDSPKLFGILFHFLFPPFCSLPWSLPVLLLKTWWEGKKTFTNMPQDYFLCGQQEKLFRKTFPNFAFCYLSSLLPSSLYYIKEGHCLSQRKLWVCPHTLYFICSFAFDCLYLLHLCFALETSLQDRCTFLTPDTQPI